MEDLKISKTMTEQERKSITPLPECALAQLNEPLSAVALYQSFKLEKDTEEPDSVNATKKQFKNKKLMSRILTASSPRVDYGDKKQAQMERISQLS